MTALSTAVVAQTRAQLAILTTFLARPGVLEVVVNRPGEVFVETYDGWAREAVAEITFARLTHLANALASATSQTFGRERPLLSGVLPDGERFQLVGPPAVAEGTLSVTIRKPGRRSFSIDELGEGGLFHSLREASAETWKGLEELRAGGAHGEFLKAAVRARLNIVISGATGSGKTTLSKALIREIDARERIITVEDTPELEVAAPNWVSLRYSKDGQGTASVGPQQLLEASLRMRPDRILLSELRDGAAFYYVRAVNAGHPGSITTIHADSCAMAIEQLTLLVKQSDGGRDLAREDVRALLLASVDVLVQCKRIDGHFRVTEIDFVAGRRQVPLSECRAE